jgi:N4-gp56 family major capsid protein
MGIMTTGTGTLSQELRTYYDRNLLSRLLPQLVWALFGQPKPMPANEGQTVNFRRFSSLSAALTPLTEGVTPAGSELSVSAITVTPSQYGDFIKISDILDFTAPDPILTEGGQLLAEQAANTIDQLVRDIVVAGTTLQYAAGRVSRVTVASTDKLTATEIQKAVRTMHTNKARKITSILNASTGVGTKPVNAGYVGIIGPYALYDLKQDSKFLTVEQYGSGAGGTLPNEVGALDEVRFIRTDNPTVYTGAGAAGIDVHATIILAADAFGVVSPMGVQNIIKPFGMGDDPLNQRATSGWKMFMKAVILQQLAILRIEHAVS